MHDNALKPEQRWELRARSADADYVEQLDIHDGTGEWKWLLKGGLKHLPAPVLLLYLNRLTSCYDDELWQALCAATLNGVVIERTEKMRLLEELLQKDPRKNGALELAYHLYGRAIPLTVFEAYLNSHITELQFDGEKLFPIVREQPQATKEAVELFIAQKGWMTRLYMLNNDFDYLRTDVAVACLAACWKDDLPLYSSFGSHDGTLVTDTLQRIAMLCVRAKDVEKAAALFQRIQDFCQKCKDTPDYICRCIGTLAPFLMLNGYALLPVEAAAPA